MGNVQRNKEEPPCVYCPTGYTPGNPGAFEDLHKRVKNIYPCDFEGAKLVIKKHLNDFSNVCHTIALSSTAPSGYKFGACYSGLTKIGPNERYPLITGELLPNGNLTAKITNLISCRLKLKNYTKLTNGKCLSSSTTAEYKSDDYTLSLTLADPDIIRQNGTLVLHYLQSISSRLTIGTEVAIHRSKLVPGGQQSILTLAMRYCTGLSTLATTVGDAGIHVSYHHRASQQLQLGVEFEANLRNHNSVGTLVYQLDVPHADMIFRGLINTETTVSGVFEKKLYPLPNTSLLLSAMLNHRKQQLRVGIGINFN